jgi:hypothetical protein
MMRTLIILVAICFSTTALAQGTPKASHKPPPVRVKPKAPTACKLVETSEASNYVPVTAWELPTKLKSEKRRWAPTYWMGATMRRSSI